jgi:hypothetical protein
VPVPDDGGTSESKETDMSKALGTFLTAASEKPVMDRFQGEGDNEE